MDFWVIIPVRYASTRLPGKPLCDIAGHPMFWHVYKNALDSGATQVIIATDDERIQKVASAYGATVCMTSTKHHSGTDRVAEVIEQYQAKDSTIVVNVQGDEPMLPSVLIRQVAAALESHPTADVATLSEPLTARQDIFNPNCVKVVCDHQGFALYFSRAPIPWARDTFSFSPSPSLEREADGLQARHIGIYAYRAASLIRITRLPISPLERIESLEQLRTLYYGGKIYVAQAAASPGIGVDTSEDLEKVRTLLELRVHHLIID